MSSSSRSLLLPLLLGLAGAFVFFGLVRDYSPRSSVDIQMSHDEIVETARAFLLNQGFEISHLYSMATFEFESGTALYLEQRLGLAEGHRKVREEKIPVHTWQVIFFDRELPPSRMPERFSVRVTPSGRIRGFRHALPDTVAQPSLTETSALELSIEFLRTLEISIADYYLDRSTTNQLPNRRDYDFHWIHQDSTFGLAEKLWVQVQGDHIGGARVSWEQPESWQQTGSNVQTVVQFIVLSATLATFFLLVFVLSLFLKKYHDGEVGTRTALLVFGALAAIILIEELLNFRTSGRGIGIGDVNRYNVRLIVFFINVFIFQAFLAIMVFAGWSVGESSARRGWGHKLKAIDGLLYGKPFTLDFAMATVRGYAFGFLGLGLIFGGAALYAKVNNYGGFEMGLDGIPESFFPAASAVFTAIRIALLSEIVLRFFFLSWLREKTGSIWPGVIVSSLIWTLIAFNLWTFPLGYVNFTALFICFFLIGMAQCWIVVRYDLLTAIFTNFTVLALTYAVPLLIAGDEYFQVQKVVFFGIIAIPLAVAGIAFIRPQEFRFTLELTPAHIRRISERERMTRELEIARTVQMSLLPKANPMLEGFDIAGICIPALEVGGDYYDFFQLNENELGIAIGDVSGKGVPAAIYMTLTKGILQSHAGETLSPREVLNKLNRQMYLNIERNSFVSLFYAVLNMRKLRIRFARAGHNPAILAQRASDVRTFIQPRGIAVGLEEGLRFHETLEEHELPLQSGDVLTFYTDGFTEASREDGSEFGEERLADIIAAHKFASSNLIIQEVVRQVKSFVGNHPQHDDMTMVVLKVL